MKAKWAGHFNCDFYFSKIKGKSPADINTDKWQCIVWISAGVIRLEKGIQKKRRTGQYQEARTWGIRADTRRDRKMRRPGSSQWSCWLCRDSIALHRSQRGSHAHHRTKPTFVFSESIWLSLVDKNSNSARHVNWVGKISEKREISW